MKHSVLRFFLPLFLPILALASTAQGAEKVPSRIADTFTPPPPGAVHIGGALGAQLDLCISNRIAVQDVEHIVAPFRDRKDQWEWRGEFWGKWITSAEGALRYTGDTELRTKVGGAVRQLLATQSPDGYIGAHPDGGHLQNWDIWSRKYTLLGLLGWHELSGDDMALSAAVRSADFMLGEVAPGKADPLKDMWGGLAASSVIEPMVLLYRRTGDERYLAHAERIVGLWTATNGPNLLNKALNGVPVFKMFAGPKPVLKEYGDAGKSKSYEMMSCFEGLLELHRTTGKPEYFDAARRVFAEIRTNEITIIGSGSDWERWCDGTRRQTVAWHKGMETCVTVTWIKFAGQLLRLTGDPMYADEIERATCNALLGAQGTDGAWWCHHAPLAGTKERAPEHCGMHQNCCVASGPRGLLLLPQLAVMASPDGPVVNLYGTSKATLPLAAGGQVRVEQRSDYPVGDTVSLTVTPDKPAAFSLRLRIPAWSRAHTVTVNDEPQPAAQAGTYATLKRTWKAGDRVVLKLDLRTRLERAPGDPSHVALVRGPLVFARDARLDTGNIDGPVAIQADAEGVVRAVALPERRLPGGWMTCKVPLADGGSLLMCDFAAAGSTWEKDSRYRVWMPTAATKP